MAKAKLDLNKFKKDLQKDMVLDKAVCDNLSISYSDEGMTDEQIQRLVYLGFDWGGLLRYLPDIEKEEMKLNIHHVKMEGFCQYLPLSIGVEIKEEGVKDTSIIGIGNEFELEAKEHTDAVIIIQDAISNPNFCINNFFYMVVFPYGDRKYKLDIKWDT